MGYCVQYNLPRPPADIAVNVFTRKCIAGNLSIDLIAKEAEISPIADTANYLWNYT